MKKFGLIALILALSVFVGVKALSPADPSIPTAPLPPEKEGKFPIMIPEYDGINQLMVLTNRWVIVAIVDIPDVMKKIDELSGGQFLPAVKKWGDSLLTTSRDWTTYRTIVEPLRNNNIAQARINAGERNFDDPAFFTITSDGDTNYTDALHPLKVTRYIAPIGGSEFNTEYPGWNIIYYAQYVYMQLPRGMKNNQNYTIATNSGKKVTFKFNIKRTVSRAIKVNQLGYIPDAPSKFAYLGAWVWEYGPLDFSNIKNFNVFNVQTGEKVFTGPVTLRANNPKIVKNNVPDDQQMLYSGENIYQMDLTPFKQEGEFFISIPGVGRSWTFRQSNDIYGTAFYLETRFMFHARRAHAVDKQYSAWSRPAYHTGPVYESEMLTMIPPITLPQGFEEFDVIGGSIDYSKPTADSAGGWYDAADWDQSGYHLTNVLDMLNAFELNPGKFKDGQLNLPESGNGIPDILDEAQWGMRHWKQSQNAKGGVSLNLEAWTHPSVDDPDVHFAYALRTRWSSLFYAGAAAQLARLVKPFNADLAQQYQDSAIKAYNFGMDPANSLGTYTIHAKQNRGQGDPYTFTFVENDQENDPYRIFAQIQMYLLTGEDKYMQGLADLLNNNRWKPYGWPFSLASFSPWLYYGMFNPLIANQLPATLLAKYKGYFLEPADEFVKTSKDDYYRHSWAINQDYYMAWGGTVMFNQARALLIAWKMTGDDKYKDAALTNIDFMLGNNPMGMSWVTGIGYVYPVDMQHWLSTTDRIDDPVPGLIPYGVTDDTHNDFMEFVWRAKKPDGSYETFMKPENMKRPLWRHWHPHPEDNPIQDEFTIHETNSAAIFDFATLMPDDWMPSDALKNLKPRDRRYLFGYWYLP